MTSRPVPATETDPIEARFLAALETVPLPLEALLRDVGEPARAGRMDTARAWAELLLETLVSAGDADGTLRLLETAAAWPGPPIFSGPTGLENLRKVFTAREDAAKLSACGFDTADPAMALRHFRRLRAIRPGAYGLDSSWGFGVIREIDDFYGRITIDFVNRRGHSVSFAHALDAIRILPEEHLLAQQHARPAEIEQSVQTQPGQIVRMAIRDFGPQNASQLEQRLTGHGVVRSADWKRFWDAARKALKDDPQCILPSRRNDPIQMRLTAVAPSAAGALDGLAPERDPRRILEIVAQWRQDGGTAETLDAATRTVLEERLRYALQGARGQDETAFVRTVLLARQCGLEEALSPTDVFPILWSPGFLERTGERLAQREADALIDHLLECSADGPARLLGRLANLPIKLLTPAIERLMRPEACAADCAAIGRARLHAVETDPAWLLWALQNRDRVEDWGWIQPSDLLTHVLAALDPPLHGEALRMQNGLRRYFERGPDLLRAMQALAPGQRRTLFTRLQASHAWDSTTQRGILARIIKRFPDLEAQTRTPDASAAAEPAAADLPRLTSRRTYRQRQRQYQRLVETEIPANSREIGQARSYGDLRENFEYHAARHQQGLLMQRKATLENDLKSVIPSDFTEASLERVEPGVRVTLVQAGGTRTVYSILGEWDRDEALGIIPSRSRVAELLMGRQTGDTVELPDSGERTQPVTLEAIEPLDPAVRAWLQTDPE